ncbi:FGGY-family carbohydrate kinase, partial [Escherichia coli]|uniref:FGGY-family carbohydrate kinase n=1 Tax=Escherichia coli TaxID=562 RepID=UPI002024E795
AARQADESAEPVWFLPYLSGERTPHNNPQAKGVFFGLTHQHGPNELARAVLEGVGYALADGMDVVHGCGINTSHVTCMGGGAGGGDVRPNVGAVEGTAECSVAQGAWGGSMGGRRGVWGGG